MRKRKKTTSNTKIAIVFFVFLILIVGASLIFKLAIVLKNGQFDSSRNFTFSITNNKHIELISLSSNPKAMTIFKFTDSVSSKEAGRILKMPIDGYISSASLDLNQKTSPLLLNLLTDYNNLETDFTIVDILRIILFEKTLPESSMEVIVVDQEAEATLDKIVSHLANDVFIAEDNQTIQIVNASDVNGAGNELAKLIGNIGGNVIIVATGNDTEKKSKILYSDEKSYTVGRLEKLLGYEVTEEIDNGIADITIIIGEDRINSNPF